MKHAQGPARDPEDPYVLHHAGLIQVHRALGAALDAVARSDPSAPLALVVERAQGAGGFLLAHHHAEDTILFPGLRRLGRRRDVDLAFLDACAREHAALHALTERLVEHAARPHPLAPELRKLAAELGQALAAHVRREELGLSPERLCAMIDAEGLACIGKELEAARARTL